MRNPEPAFLGRLRLTFAKHVPRRRVDRRLAYLVSSCLIVFSPLATAESLTLSAATGNYSTKTLAAASKAIELDVLVVGKTEHGNERWPSAALVGLSDGPDRRNSLQLFLVRDRVDARRVTVGLRLILDGEEVNAQEIGTLTTFGPASVTLSFREGRAAVQLNSEQAIEVTLPFERAMPYVAVNSCTALFDWKIRGKSGNSALEN